MVCTLMYCVAHPVVINVMPWWYILLAIILCTVYKNHDYDNIDCVVYKPYLL